jgi:FlaA1/EpsC-like NDP-sugar epimerase
VTTPGFVRWLPKARQRSLVQATTDATATVVGLVAAVLIRFELDMPDGMIASTAGLAVLATVVQLATGASFGLYAGRWRFGGFEEVTALTQSLMSTTLVVAVVNRFMLGRPVPVSATLMFGMLTLGLTAAARWYWRLHVERRMRPGSSARRMLVFGAGEAGSQVITSMMRNPTSPYLPVALLDDDRDKRNLRMLGIQVVGGRRYLHAAKERFDADVLLIAIPSADRTVISDLSTRAADVGLDVLVLPSVTELFGGHVDVSDIRPLSESDLLGRRAVDTDVESVAGYLTGRRVLVTGAGGSIGSELCRQIYRFAPDSLIMLERDESALHAVQLSIEGRALLDTRNLVVCDIRDAERLTEVFVEHRPEVVFHAAALKHLPLLEMHPSEAFKTNCVATQHLLDASIRFGVERFVNISTDKAADPCSVLGYTKRIAERLTAAASQRSTGTYLSVRFGNVLGSRGSVLTSFRAQIEAGGPITVTHPEVTRYFMTVEEAVQLVIQAGAVGHDGEAMVLDMGEPVRIADVAQRLADQADRTIEIVFTGLRPGEKLHEVLLGVDEDDNRPAHPQISHVPVPPLDARALRLAGTIGKERLSRLSAVSTLTPSERQLSPRSS